MRQLAKDLESAGRDAPKLIDMPAEGALVCGRYSAGKKLSLLLNVSKSYPAETFRANCALFQIMHGIELLSLVILLWGRLGLLTLIMATRKS